MEKITRVGVDLATCAVSDSVAADALFRFPSRFRISRILVVAMAASDCILASAFRRAN